MSLPIFVLITPARNEVRFLEQTVESVVAQTIRPARWVIVSDGSVDGTDDIVRKYTTRYSWIQLIRMPERADRNFAGKVNAFNAGHRAVSDIPYEFIVNMDADVTLEPDYFEFLLGKMVENPSTGLGGTPFIEGTVQRYDYRFVSIEHVSGLCQMFRRQCFEAIGGYTPVKGGGIDLIAVVSARMKGWQTRTFPGRSITHHRVMGTEQAYKLTVWYKNGIKDYTFGGHPAWQFFRSVYQMTNKPYVVGGLFLGCGYVSAYLKGVARPVTPEWVEFRRNEQMQRLKQVLFGRLKKSLFVWPQDSR
jgi:glycosyltransferase involved in cell wall biosynthesis